MAPKWLTKKALNLSPLCMNLRRHRTGGVNAAAAAISTFGPKDVDLKVHRLHKTFVYLDGDGDGKISSDELRVFFASMGDDNMSNNKEAIEGVIDDHDFDGDDLLDFEDFVRLVDKDGGEEDLRRAFEMFEVEKGSGYITPRGLQRMLSRIGDDKSFEECEAMIRAFDLDGNGVIDFGEFQLMMTWENI